MIGPAVDLVQSICPRKVAEHRVAPGVIPQRMTPVVNFTDQMRMLDGGFANHEECGLRPVVIQKVE
jgi:hypothetical protein